MDIPTKDEVAAMLAGAHMEIDSGVLHVFRLVSTPDREADPDEPIKLLEVYEHAIASGVAPVHFPKHPESGLHYPAEFIQIAPEELEQVRSGALPLPDGWSLGAEYPRPSHTGHSSR